MKNSLPSNHTPSPDTPLSAWLPIQQSLAEKNNIALTTLDESNIYVGETANENSICQAMQKSPVHANRCDADCGTAYQRAIRAVGKIEYTCHVGLKCFAFAAHNHPKPLVILGGRTFTSSANYSKFLNRYQDYQPVETGAALQNIKFNDPFELAEIAEVVSSTANAHFAREHSSLSSINELENAPNLLDAHLEIIRLSDELENKNRALVQFQDFLRDVAPTLDSQSVYLDILKKFNEIMKAERGSLMLYNPETAELSLEAAVGADFESLSKIRVKLGEGISGAVLYSGLPLLVHNVDTDRRVRSSRAANYKTKSFISYPITLGSRKFGVLNLTDRKDGTAYDKQDLLILDMIAPQIALIIDRTEWYKKAEQYQQMSLTDELTGLPNRRYLEERLFEEVERSKRHNTPLAFMLIDIDYFKSYNDLYGHTNADRMLIQVANIFRRSIRTIDMPARFAGDEFCIILPETDLASASRIAERLCKEVRQIELATEQGGEMNRVTLSIGVSSFSKSINSPHLIIQSADAALYEAKARGRDQVAIFEE
ncbi:MAG: diguanylate cyclase [Acidobacteriota bacterium]